MLKLGMKPIPGVSRVTVKKSKNVSFLPSLSIDLILLPTHFLDFHSAIIILVTCLLFALDIICHL